MGARTSVGGLRSRAVSPTSTEPRERQPPDALVPVPAPVAALPEQQLGGGRVATRTVSQGDMERRRGQTRSVDRQPLRALTTEDDIMRDLPSAVPQPHRPRPRSRLPVTSTRLLGSPQVAALYTEAVANIEQAQLVDPVEPKDVEAVVGSSAAPQPLLLSGKPSPLVRRTGSAISSTANDEVPAKHTSSEGAFLRGSTALPPAKGSNSHYQQESSNATNDSTPVPEPTTPGAPDSVSILSEQSSTEQSTRQASESGDACEEVSKNPEDIIEIDMIAPASADGFYFGTSYSMNVENTDYFAQVQMATLASMDAAPILEGAETEEDLDTQIEMHDEPLNPAENQVEIILEVDTKEDSSTVLISQISEHEPEVRESESSFQTLSVDGLMPDEQKQKDTTEEEGHIELAISENDLCPEVTEIVKACTVLTAASSIAAPSGSSTALDDREEDTEQERSEEAADLSEGAGDDTFVGCEVHLKAVAGGILDPATDVSEDQRLRVDINMYSNATELPLSEENEEEDNDISDEKNDALVSLANKLELKRRHSEQQGQGTHIFSADQSNSYSGAVANLEEAVVLTSRSEASTGRIRTLGAGRVTAEGRRTSDSSTRFNKIIQSCKQKIFTSKLSHVRKTIEKRPQHRFSHFSRTALFGTSEVCEQQAKTADNSENEASPSVDGKDQQPDMPVSSTTESTKPSTSLSSASGSLSAASTTVRSTSKEEMVALTPMASETNESHGGVKKNFVVASLFPNSESKSKISTKTSKSNRSRSFSIESSRSSRASIAPPRTNFLTEDVLRSLTKSYGARYSDVQIGSKPRQLSKTPERYKSSPSSGSGRIRTKSGSVSICSTASSSVASTPKKTVYSGTTLAKSKQKFSKGERKTRKRKVNQTTLGTDDGSDSLPKIIISGNLAVCRVEEEEAYPENTSEGRQADGMEPESVSRTSTIEVLESMPKILGLNKTKKKLQRKEICNKITEQDSNNEINYQKIPETNQEYVKTYKDEFDILLQNPYSKLLERSESVQENRSFSNRVISGCTRSVKPHSCILDTHDRKLSITEKESTTKNRTKPDLFRRSQTKQTILRGDPSISKQDVSEEIPIETDNKLVSVALGDAKGTRSLKLAESVLRYRPTLRTPRISCVGMHAGNEVTSIVRKNIISEMKARSRARIASKHPSRPPHAQLKQSEECKSSKMVDSTDSVVVTSRVEPLKTSFDGLEEIAKLLTQLTEIDPLGRATQEASDLVSLFEASNKHSIPSEDNESRAALCTSTRPSADEVNDADNILSDLPGDTDAFADVFIPEVPEAPSKQLTRALNSEEREISTAVEKDGKCCSDPVDLKSEEDPPLHSFSICSNDTEIKVASTLRETASSSLCFVRGVGNFIERLDLSDTQTDSTSKSIEESQFHHEKSLYHLRLPLIQISPPFPEEDSSGRVSPCILRVDTSPKTSVTDEFPGALLVEDASCITEHLHGYTYTPSNKISTFARAAPLFRTNVKVCVDKGMNTNTDSVSATVNTNTWVLSPSRHTVEKVSDAVQVKVATVDADSQATCPLSVENVCETAVHGPPADELVSSRTEKLFQRRRALPSDVPQNLSLSQRKSQDSNIRQLGRERDDDKIQSKKLEDFLWVTDLQGTTVSNEYIPRSCHQLILPEKNSSEVQNCIFKNRDSQKMGNNSESVPRDIPKLTGVERARLRISCLLGDHLPTTLLALLNEVLPVLLERTQSELRTARHCRLKKIFSLDYLNHPENQLPRELQSPFTNEQVQLFVTDMADKVALFVEDMARSSEGVPCCQKPP